MEVVAENRIGRRIFGHIRALAIPRFTGSAGERRAQEYIRNLFQEMNYPVTEQEFVSSLFPLELLPRIGVALVSGILVMALGFVRTVPALTVELGLLTLLLLLLGSRWSRRMERLYALRKFGRIRSRNIIAVHPMQERHLNVIFTAHYDSKSQTFSGAVRFALFAAFAATAALSGAACIAVAVARLPESVLFFTVIPACVLALLVQVNATKNASPGAYDNASGVAVMLELARRFDGEMPNANLVFVAVGAEEAGLCGAVALATDERFVEQFPPERSIVVNLDGLGSKGRLRVTDRHGIPPVRSGPLVADLCREVSRRFGLDVSMNWLPTGAGMDHVPFAAHGYQSVTLSTAGWNAAFLAMHTRRDTPERLDVQTLEHAFAVCQEIVDSIPSMQRNRA
jgi:hypothetical protein